MCLSLIFSSHLREARDLLERCRWGLAWLHPCPEWCPESQMTPDTSQTKLVCSRGMVCPLVPVQKPRPRTPWLFMSWDFPSWKSFQCLTGLLRWRVEDRSYSDMTSCRCGSEKTKGMLVPSTMNASGPLGPPCLQSAEFWGEVTPCLQEVALPPLGPP